MTTALEEMKAACRASDDAIKKREAVLFELAQLRSIPRPTPAIAYWVAPSLIAVFCVGLLLGGWLL